MNYLDNTIDNIKHKLNIDDGALADMMELSLRKLARAKGNYTKLPLSSLFNLSQYLGISLRNMEVGNIDYDALFEHYQGNKCFIPKRYQKYQKSKISTINNCLSFVEEHLSLAHVNEIKKRVSNYG